jgi:hypothetical protein
MLLLLYVAVWLCWLLLQHSWLPRQGLSLEVKLLSWCRRR